MIQQLPLATAATLRVALTDVVCSEPWLNSLFQPQDVAVCDFDDGQYPPGGDGTLMRQCPSCKRITPPNGNQQVCCDCETEREEDRFQERCEPASEHDRFQMRQRWWCEPIRSRELTLLPNSHRNSSDVADDDTIEAPARDFQTSLDDAYHRLGRPTTAVRFYDPIPRDSLSGLPQALKASLLDVVNTVAGQSQRSLRPVLSELRIICRQLPGGKIEQKRSQISLVYGNRRWCLLRFERTPRSRNVSIGSGRSAGCELTLLSE